MGGIGYTNSGIETFLNFTKSYKSKYNFFILTQDISVSNLLKRVQITHIEVDMVKFDDLPNYFRSKNIRFAFHARERSFYDDLTFPIKVLDFTSMLIPTISDYHKPLVRLFGNNYPLFSDIKDFKRIERLIEEYINNNSYELLIDTLKRVRSNNLYKNRIAKLESMSSI